MHFSWVRVNLLWGISDGSSIQKSMRLRERIYEVSVRQATPEEDFRDCKNESNTEEIAFKRFTSFLRPEVAIFSTRLNQY